ncbi:MAG: indolepyruvate/phenylpyruvate decarboxylase [Deltaproteobacteria bacterium]|nr:indolepyruvate/phenylpyruvate decarboxylase [Deltaproteobacteria bacterium]
MKARMRVGDFLVAYLQKIGVTHLFGIPGDLVINLFFKFGRPRGLRIVTLSHEPGVGFAADGYARATGRIGVVCVTYGAGGFNMVNPVAGSFSERVPILVVSGGPGEEERKLGQLIHHQAKEIESQYKVYDEITCAAAILDDPRRMADEIDRVVRAIWREQRPGYLEIHRDMVDRVIEVPEAIRAWDGGLEFARSDERKTAEAARETATRFNGARKPAVIVGIETFRYKLQHEIVKLVERMGAPCMTTVLGKGAFPMDHPLAMGVHIGPLSPPPIRRRVDEADLVLNLGTLLTDMNLGSRPPQIARDRAIWAVGNRVNVSCHTYTDVGIRDFVRALQRQRLRRHRERVAYADNLKPSRGPLGRAVAVADMLREVNRFLAGKRGWAVIAESGDMLFAGLDVRIGRGGAYLAQGYYASMGFGVPGALGLEIGTGKRPIVLCGDGAFQMTGVELAQAPRYGLRPIVVLMNNGGWGIFRPIAEREDLLAIPNWPYAELARAWGGVGYVAATVAELRDALADAERGDAFALIETRVDPHDLSPVSRKYIEASARKAGIGRAPITRAPRVRAAASRRGGRAPAAR